MDFSPPEEVFTVIQNSEKSVFTEVKDERGGFGKFVFTKNKSVDLEDSKAKTRLNI